MRTIRGPSYFASRGRLAVGMLPGICLCADRRELLYEQETVGVLDNRVARGGRDYFSHRGNSRAALPQFQDGRQ